MTVSSDLGRVRDPWFRRPGVGPDVQRSPFPWMSFPEGIVFKWLLDNEVPFSWRNFDGKAPLYEQLVMNTGYHPEFTIRELRVVIMIQGNFFGLIPSVLDKVSLAKVTLEMDGWRVLVLWEHDLRAVPTEVLLTTWLPDLLSVKGPYRPPDWDVPDVRVRLRERPVALPRPALRDTVVRERGDGGDRDRRSWRHRIGSSGRRRFNRRRFGPGGQDRVEGD